MKLLVLGPDNMKLIKVNRLRFLLICLKKLILIDSGIIHSLEDAILTLLVLGSILPIKEE